MTYDSRESSAAGAAPIELFRFSMGSTVWRYTSGDVAVGRDVGAGDGAQNFVTEVLKRAELDYSQEDSGGSLEVRVPRTNPVAALFIPFAPPLPVGLTAYRFHDGDAETVVIFIGKVASVAFEDTEAVLTCQPIQAMFSRTLPRLYFQKQCNWSLYSTQCGVSRAAFGESTYGGVRATITVLSGLQVTAPVLGIHGDGWYDGGYLELDSGTKRLIVSQVGDVATLQNPLIGVAVGEPITVYPGCDKTEATCGAKFSNLSNHFGFARIPYRNPFTTGITS